MRFFSKSLAASIAHALHGPKSIVAPADFRVMETKDDGGNNAPEIKTLEDLKSAFLGHHRDLKSFIDKANAEIKETGKTSTETKSALEALTTQINTIGTRIDKVEAKGNREDAAGQERKSLGTQFIEMEDYKTFGASRGTKLRFNTKAILNATGQNQPLVPQQQLAGIQQQPNRRLRVRNLLQTGRTTSNLIQYAKENVFTNNAGPQADGSPTVAAEGALKNQSDITFVLANAPVVTLAHFILASRQVLDDAPMLQSYIDGRLLYGLALEEEDEILNGDGSVGTLDGLMHQATFFNRATAGDTRIDTLRRSVTQLQVSEYDPEFIVLNPEDWEVIELTKDTQGRYIIANPQSLLGPTLWGLPVVPTNSMTKGQFLTANGTQAAQLWDREDASVELSREDSDNFRRNMVTLLAEERLALTVYRPQALIKGAF